MCLCATLHQDFAASGIRAALSEELGHLLLGLRTHVRKCEQRNTISEKATALRVPQSRARGNTQGSCTLCEAAQLVQQATQQRGISAQQNAHKTHHFLDLAALGCARTEAQ